MSDLGFEGWIAFLQSSCFIIEEHRRLLIVLYWLLSHLLQ